jgi:hypothetical protein
MSDLGVYLERLSKTYRGKLFIDEQKATKAYDDAMRSASAFSAPEVDMKAATSAVYDTIMSEKANQKLVKRTESMLKKMNRRVRWKYRHVCKELGFPGFFPQAAPEIRVLWKGTEGNGMAYEIEEDSTNVMVPTALSDDKQLIEDSLAEEYIHSLCIMKRPDLVSSLKNKPQYNFEKDVFRYVLEGIVGVFLPSGRVDHDRLLESIKRGEISRETVLGNPHIMGRAMLDAINRNGIGINDILKCADSPDKILSFYHDATQDGKRII